jgi:hypothetical protein
MRAPIVLWPYPIDPLPGGPLPPRYDLLIYEKSGIPRGLPEELQRRWPASIRVPYPRYQREQMIELARQSRACDYLSDNDRGPLALAEILLAGCPAVGVSRGSPWIVDGQTGFHVSAFDFPELSQAIQRAMQIDRDAVCRTARERFDARWIVQTVLAALDAARDDR